MQWLVLSHLYVDGLIFFFFLTVLIRDDSIHSFEIRASSYKALWELLFCFWNSKCVGSVWNTVLSWGFRPLSLPVNYSFVFVLRLPTINRQGLFNPSRESQPDCSCNAGWAKVIMELVNHLLRHYVEASLFVVGAANGAGLLVLKIF